MSKDSSIYKGKFDKLKNSIQNDYYCRNNKPGDFNIIKKLDKQELIDKLSTIFNNNNFVYKADVIIMYKNGENKSEKIICKKDDYLITLDNKKIYLDDISDIN